jgi:hypothetical protein
LRIASSFELATTHPRAALHPALSHGPARRAFDSGDDVLGVNVPPARIVQVRLSIQRGEWFSPPLSHLMTREFKRESGKHSRLWCGRFP